MNKYESVPFFRNGDTRSGFFVGDAEPGVAGIDTVGDGLTNIAGCGAKSPWV